MHFSVFILIADIDYVLVMCQTLYQALMHSILYNSYTKFMNCVFLLSSCFIDKMI